MELILVCLRADTRTHTSHSHFTHFQGKPLRLNPKPLRFNPKPEGQTLKSRMYFRPVFLLMQIYVLKLKPETITPKS